MSEKLFSGTSSTTFSPEEPMTRGMFVTVLGNKARIDPKEYPTSSFSDVKAGVWYAPNVEWAVHNGIVNGTGGGRFSPNKSVTREQIAVILYNYAKFTNCDLTTRAGLLDQFPDGGRVSGYAKYAMEWAITQHKLYDFQVSAFQKNAGGHTLAWTVRWGAKERNQGRLHQLTALFHGPNNLGILEYRLNGRHDLDGSWRLGDRVGRGLSMVRFLVNWHSESPERVGMILLLSARIRSPVKGFPGVRFGVAGVNRDGFVQGKMAASSHVDNLQKARAFVVADTRWRLDGSYQLNGEKRLKADIERSEL